MAKLSEFNRPSVDEMYANGALLLLLDEVRKEIFTARILSREKAATQVAEPKTPLSNWILPRLALRLEAMPNLTPSITSKRERLMQAQVDGYLCRRVRDDFSSVPLAICEAKPCVRSEHFDAILRQETAEMACWISEHGSKAQGLLQTAAEGAKRRLMVSQDRHEIYVIIGEYGPKYVDYIRGHASLSARAPLPADKLDVEKNQKAAVGSASYNKQAEVTGVDKIRTSLGDEKKPAPGGMVLRSRVPRVLPPADEFLVMHQFGPFITSKADHMDRLVRRLIGFMLQLDTNPAETSRSLA